MVGRATDSGVCRVVTVAEHVDEPRSVEFQLPKSEADLQHGRPLWANYVKGVVAFFPRKGLDYASIFHTHTHTHMHAHTHARTAPSD